MAASCVGPLAVGVTEEGAGAGVQAATNRKRHRPIQGTRRQAVAVFCISVPLIETPPLDGRASREQLQRLLFEGKPTALLSCGCPVAAVSLGMPPVFLCHRHTVLSRRALQKREEFS